MNPPPPSPQHRSLASFTRCFVNNRTDHSVCPSDEYCAVIEGFGNNEPRCWHCRFCYSAPSSSSSSSSITTTTTTGQDFAVPSDGVCPPKCSCTSHTEDCGDREYCSRYNEQRNVCLPCAHCRNPDNKPFDSDTSCPQKCFCRSSAECNEGEFCAQLEQQQQQKQQSVQQQESSSTTLTPAGQGLCMSCSSTTGCLEAILLQPHEEKCRDVCSREYECDQHSDCDGSSSISDDGHYWCSANHRCHECSSDCWTPLRLLPLPNLSAWWESITEDEFLENEISEISIDLSCPESCCDWGYTVEHPLQTQFAVGPCDVAVQVSGYWEYGHTAATRTQAGVGVPTNLPEERIPCQVERHEFTTGYPRAVTLVDCSEASTKCEKAERTLGLVLVNSSSQDGTPPLWASDDFPYEVVFENANFNCAFQEAGGDLGMSLFVSLICSFSFFFVVTAMLVWRTRQVKRKRKENVD